VEETKTDSYSTQVCFPPNIRVWLMIRVVNTIRSWLDVHYLEDQDASILDRVDQFVDALTAEGSGMMAKQLTNLVIRRVSHLFI
jgi:hypothetical protein